MEKSQHRIRTKKVVLGILELGIVTKSDVRGGRGVGKSDKKWQEGGGGGSNLDFSSDVIYEWPLTQS